MIKHTTVCINTLVCILILTACSSSYAFIDAKLFLFSAYKQEFQRDYASFRQFLSDCIHDPLNNKKVEKLHAENKALQQQLDGLMLKTTGDRAIKSAEPSWYGHTIVALFTASTTFIVGSSIIIKK